MKNINVRLAALEAQQRPDPLMVAVGEADDPTNPRGTYHNIRTYVIDSSRPFDYDEAIAMIAAEVPYESS